MAFHSSDNAHSINENYDDVNELKRWNGKKN